MKATKKIVGAACALVAAVALSAGSTFAWFTANNVVKVGQVEGTVVTMGGDLKIALVTETKTESTTTYSEGPYAYSLTAPEFKAAGATEASQFTHVTSSDGVTFTGVPKQQDKADPDTGKEWVAGAEAVAMKDYYTYTVSLLSDTKMDIYLQQGDTTLTSSGTTDTAKQILAWKAITENDYGKAVELNNRITAEAKDAARVAFNVFTMTYGEDGKVASATKDTSAKFWNPGEATGFSKGNLALDYFNYNNQFAEADKLTDAGSLGNKVSDIKPIATAGSPATGDVKLCTLEAGKPQYITISLWLEGFDGDCFNSIFSQTLTFGVGFYGAEVAETPVP